MRSGGARHPSVERVLALARIAADMASVLRERTEGYAQKLKTSIPVVGTAWNRR